MSRVEERADRIWALMKDIGVAMVVTHSGHGDQLRARPMAATADRADNSICFLTDASAPKDAEVKSNSNVCIAFSDIKGQKYVSVTGSASVSNDRARIKQLWSAADKAFWRDENDPAIRLLRVAPEEAEYWEGPGMIVSAVKLIKAAMGGAKQDLGKNEKAPMARGARG
jgi:general stress protein 26